MGLDQYEVRRWDGWYRHITLAIVKGPPQNGLNTYDINVSATSGSTLDPKIELYDPKGNLVAEDDNRSLGATAARIKYTLESWDGGATT